MMCLELKKKKDSISAVMEEIVFVGKYTGLDTDEGDINKLIEEHSEELTTEELTELQMHAAAHGGFAGNR